MITRIATCSATSSPKNLETGWRLRESVTMMRLMGEVVKRKMLKTVFFTALRKCSLRSVVLAKLITTMARLMWWADGWLTELGERRGAEMILARGGTQWAKVVGGNEEEAEVDEDEGEEEEAGELAFWF